MAVDRRWRWRGAKILDAGAFIAMARTNFSQSVCREWYSQRLLPPFPGSIVARSRSSTELSYGTEWPSSCLVACFGARELSFAMVRWTSGVFWGSALRAGSSRATCGGWPTNFVALAANHSLTVRMLASASATAVATVRKAPVTVLCILFIKAMPLHPQAWI